MPRVAGFSKFLTEGLVPLCIFGLLSSLILHLIDLRSAFIAGGEGRLRLAALAFAGGIVLVQRLRPSQGRESSRNYGCALFAVVTLFSLYHANAYIFGVPTFLVFLVNVALFGLLMWAGIGVTEACAVDSEENQAAAAHSGSLFFRTGRDALEKRKKEEEEEPTEEERDAQWAERLPKRHPGRVLLYFSLVALPLFGAGVYVFDPSDYALRMRTGAYLFVYLWCAFALLALSSLRQLGAYFEKRDVSLPEAIALPWMAIAFLVLTVALLMAALLPQPPSAAGLFVRDRIVSVYRGPQSKYGFRDASRPGGGGSGAAKAREWADGRLEHIDALGDDYLSEMARTTGWEGDLRQHVALIAATEDSFRDTFDLLLKGVCYIVLPLCALVALYAILMAIAQGFSLNLGTMRWMRKRPETERTLEDLEEKLEKKKTVETRPFGAFADPFSPGYGPSDGDALVRHCWEAMLAYCGELGAPCPADQTPQGFIRTAPEPLEGFEEEARFIALLFSFSEYSGQPVARSAREELREFWERLQRHAGANR